VTPHLSVVVMAHGRSPRLLSCLQSVQRQLTALPYEILVVLNPADGDIRSPADLAGVRWVELRERLHPGEARNAGWTAAEGEIVAFLMANCTALPGWLDALADEHRRRPEHPVGGPVRLPDNARIVETAAYFCELAAPPVPDTGRYADDWPICNLSYPRRLLEAAGGFAATAGGSDRELHEHLRANGVRIWVSPRPAVTYHPIDNVGDLLGHEFRAGRLYGDLRASREGLSRRGRALRALAWWILPGVFALRGLKQTRDDMRTRLLFLRSVHILLLGWTARALGDATGLLHGPARVEGTA